MGFGQGCRIILPFGLEGCHVTIIKGCFPYESASRHGEEIRREDNFEEIVGSSPALLHVLPLHNPSLRERQADIAQLAMFFLSRYAKRFGKELDGIAQETMQLLVHYSWPGNVRELQNIIERGVVLATGRVLTLERSLLPAMQTTEPLRAHVSLAPPMPAPVVAAASDATSFDDIARQHILSVLEQTHWVIEGAKGAAQLLNLHPNTLRSRMKKLGIRRPPSPL